MNCSSHSMGLIKIPKKRKGEFRLIYAPNNKEKSHLYQFIPYLHDLCDKLCDYKIVHGFMLSKSPITNSLQHIGYNFTVSFDLKDFFDTVTKSHVAHIITESINKLALQNNNLDVKDSSLVIDHLFIDDHCYQGLPTSPLVANLAAVKMDREIRVSLDQLDEKVVYTRYADDLTISFNNYNNLVKIKSIIIDCVKINNFTLNDKKTRLQSCKFGYRNVTGINVGSINIHLPRRIKRRIRALNYLVKSWQKDPNKQNSKGRYQINRWSYQLKGLTEYSKLKTPRPSPFHFVDILRKFREVIRITNVVSHGSFQTKEFVNNPYSSLTNIINASLDYAGAKLTDPSFYKNKSLGYEIRRYIKANFNNKAQNTYLKPISNIVAEEKKSKVI